jgi:hypothetical protein
VFVIFGVCVITIAPMVTVLLVAFGAILLFAHRGQLRSMRPSLAGVEGITHPLDFVLDLDGITATTPTSASRFRWSAFSSWVNDRDGIMLLLDEGLQWRWLPRRAATPHEWQLVMELVSANLPPYAGKVSGRVNRR